MKFTSRLFVLFTVLDIVSPSFGAERCEPWSGAGLGYSICLPTGWYHRTMSSGALFLCDQPQGKCVTDVGGDPLRGHATLSVIPAEFLDLPGPISTLRQFANDAVSDKESSRFSSEGRVETSSGTLTYISVSQTYSNGALNSTPIQARRIFVSIDKRFLEFAVFFNSDDKRANWYMEIAMKMVSSIRRK